MSDSSPPAVTLRQLQYIVAIDQNRSFSKAAACCFVSQPSLSSQVAQVEGLLGVQIFERTRRGVMTTAVGNSIVEHAKAVLRASQDLERVAEAARSPWTARWRFGVIPTIAAYLLPKLAPALKAVHPNLSVIWREATTDELVSELETGDLDAAIVALETDLGSLVSVPLARDPFVLVVDAGHRLAKRRTRVSFREIDDDSLLLLEEGHCLRDQALSVCGRNDTEGFASTSMATLIELVAIGEGVTLLPRVATSALEHDGRVSLLNIKRPEPYRTIGMTWRPSSSIAEQLTEVSRLFSVQLKS